MLCDNCGKERLETDFINNQKFCYRCEYRKKLEIIPQKRTKNPNFCRMCGIYIVHIENLKKRQRNIFCSSGCAEKGHKELIENHWTRKIRSKGVI